MEERKEFETSNGKFLLQRLPDSIKYNIGISDKNILFADTNDSNNWKEFKVNLLNDCKIIGFISEVTEEQCEEVVEFVESNHNCTCEYCNRIVKLYKDYNSNDYGFKDSQYSFRSLCESLKIMSEFKNENSFKQLETHEQHSILSDLKDYIIGNWLLIKLL